VTAVLSRKLGRHWTFAWIFGLPNPELVFHLGWCRKHGIDAFIAEPRDKDYELQRWGNP